MASKHASLDAAAVDRKARLAKLASLKRKQSEVDTPATFSTEEDPTEEKVPSGTDVYLSGRNYDIQSRGAKLGFENTPSSDVSTLERQASLVISRTAEQATKDEEAAEKGIDLFKLQPKKPNWDLKRDLDEKMKILNVRTQNAIARLVRERIETAKSNAKQQGKQADTGSDLLGEEVGMDGNTLVEGVHVREREEQEDERREKELDEEDGIA